MPILNEKQIRYGVNYNHSDEPSPKRIIEVSEYTGEDSLIINCTQLGDSFTPQFKSPKEKKRILNEWCEFLSKNTTLFTELTFGTRMPQALFNAVCKQTNLKKLYIKWGQYPDISMLSELVNLEYLHIGSGSSVHSIEVFSKLKNLVSLSVENFQKITDYSCVAELDKLESLYIEGDVWGGKHIHIDSLSFLNKMPQLRFFCLLAAQLKDKDFTPILYLKNIEHLELTNNKEVKKLHEQISQLPKLKYGSLIGNPQIWGEKT